MIERYTRKEIKKIWEDYNRYSIWLEIELAAAEAMEKLKIIPKGIVKKVKKKANINRYNCIFNIYYRKSRKRCKIFTQRYDIFRCPRHMF